MPDVPSCNIYPLCCRALRIHFLVSSTRDLQALLSLRALRDPRALRPLYIPSRLTFFARLTCPRASRALRIFHVIVVLLTIIKSII